MLRTLGWAIWLFGYLIGRLPAYWKARRLEKRGQLAERDAWARYQVMRWAPRLLKHVKARVTVAGRENLPPAGQAVVFASNHQSFLDIPVILSSLDEPHALMARSGIGKVPFLRGWMEQLRCVFIERDDARAAMTALKEGEEVLESGRSLIIFPEGTRSKGGPVAEFKAGAMRIAYKVGAPIVPVALQGTARALEGNNMRVQPSDITLTILPAVQTKGLDRAAQKALPGQIEQMVRDVVDGPGAPAPL